MKTIDKKKFIAFALFLVIVIIAFTFIGRGHFYKAELFRSGQGWGYDILKNEKVYIHQPFIPAIEGEVPFSDKRSARKTGKLVISKLMRQKSPTVTKEELERILGDEGMEGLRG